MQSNPPKESVDKETEADLVTAELEVLLKKQSEIKQSVVKTGEKIRKLIIESGNEKLIATIRETSFTQAVRIILASEEMPITRVELRVKFRELGFDTEKYSNFLASLNITLERMKRQGEVIETRRHNGRKQYSKGNLRRRLHEIVD